MRDSTDHTSTPTERSAPIERRTVLQAAGAAGLVPFVGIGAGETEVATAEVAVPAVLLSNLSDRERTIELRLGVSTSTAGLQTDRATFSLAPSEHTKLDSLDAAFGSTVLQSLGEADGGTLAISDAEDRYESTSVDPDLDASNRILGVVATQDGLQIQRTHFDAIGVGGDSQ